MGAAPPRRRAPARGDRVRWVCRPVGRAGRRARGGRPRPPGLASEGGGVGGSQTPARPPVPPSVPTWGAQARLGRRTGRPAGVGGQASGTGVPAAWRGGRQPERARGRRQAEEERRERQGDGSAGRVWAQQTRLLAGGAGAAAPAAATGRRGPTPACSGGRTRRRGPDPGRWRRRGRPCGRVPVAHPAGRSRARAVLPRASPLPALASDAACCRPLGWGGNSHRGHRGVADKGGGHEAWGFSGRDDRQTRRYAGALDHPHRSSRIG